jgi:hypothetical protein
MHTLFLVVVAVCASCAPLRKRIDNLPQIDDLDPVMMVKEDAHELQSPRSVDRFGTTEWSPTSDFSDFSELASPLFSSFGFGASLQNFAEAPQDAQSVPLHQNSIDAALFKFKHALVDEHAILKESSTLESAWGRHASDTNHVESTRGGLALTPVVSESQEADSNGKHSPQPSIAEPPTEDAFKLDQLPASVCATFLGTFTNQPQVVADVMRRLDLANMRNMPIQYARYLADPTVAAGVLYSTYGPDAILTAIRIEPSNLAIVDALMSNPTQALNSDGISMASTTAARLGKLNLLLKWHSAGRQISPFCVMDAVAGNHKKVSIKTFDAYSQIFSWLRETLKIPKEIMDEALVEAVTNRQFDFIMWVLDAQPDSFSTESLDDSIAIVLGNNNIELARLLLQKNQGSGSRDGIDRGLAAAAQAGHSDAVEFVLQDFSPSQNGIDQAFAFAATANQVEIMDIVLKLAPFKPSLDGMVLATRKAHSHSTLAWIHTGIGLEL